MMGQSMRTHMASDSQQLPEKLAELQQLERELRAELDNERTARGTATSR